MRLIIPIGALGALMGLMAGPVAAQTSAERTTDALQKVTEAQGYLIQAQKANNDALRALEARVGVEFDHPRHALAQLGRAFQPP